MGPARILIVTSGPLCRNPRVFKEATALGHAGFDVIVLTVANIERFEAYDRDLLTSAPFRKIALDRLSSNPFDRLVFLAERIHGKLARHALRLGLESPASLGPYRALARLALRIPADLTIVHTEVPFFIGTRLLKAGRKIAADFEDWHSRDLLPDAQAGRPIQLLNRTESILMRKSVYTSAPSAAMSVALQSSYGGRYPAVIPNTFPLQSSFRRDSGRDLNPVPAFFWFSQTIGPGRGLESFLGAWALTRNPSRVCLLGDVSHGYAQSLLSLVPVTHRPHLHFLPLTSPENLPVVISAHDIGLALEPPAPESRALTITNKIFQYMNAGLAILATPTPGQREVFAEAPGIGLLIELGHPAVLAGQLDDLLSEPARLAAMGHAARQAAVDRYCWEKTEPTLIATIRAALGQPDF